MVRRSPLTIHTIPLFADDDEIGEVVLGFDRRRKFRELARFYEHRGMPEFSEIWGGRYVPAVLGFLEHHYGWKGEYSDGDPGREGDFHSRSPPLKSSRESEAYYASPENKRERYRQGRVRVTAPDGKSWIEDARPTDPKSWWAVEPWPSLGPNAEEKARARGYVDKNGNARRAARGVGKVKVTAPDGRSWIEDANEADPKLWHRKLPFKPKRKSAPPMS